MIDYAKKDRHVHQVVLTMLGIGCSNEQKTEIQRSGRAGQETERARLLEINKKLAASVTTFAAVLEFLKSAGDIPGAYEGT